MLIQILEFLLGLAKLSGFGYKSYVTVNSFTQAGFCNIKFQHEFSKTVEKVWLKTFINNYNSELIGT